MKNPRLAGTRQDIHPPPTGIGALDPALRQALMRVNPDYFAWSLEAQERYRVSMPEQDAFRLRQALLKALFGLHAHTEEDLAEISNRFSDKEHLVFNRALLPAAGVGEDSFFLNEYLDEGKTLLVFDKGCKNNGVTGYHASSREEGGFDDQAQHKNGCVA